MSDVSIYEVGSNKFHIHMYHAILSTKTKAKFSQSEFYRFLKIVKALSIDFKMS